MAVSLIPPNGSLLNCPAGTNSWCSYRRAEAEGMDVSKFKHDYLSYLFELLERCKGGNTQNNNAS